MSRKPGVEAHVCNLTTGEEATRDPSSLDGQQSRQESFRLVSDVVSPNKVGND